MDIDALRAELAKPKYAEMTAEEAAASLNRANIDRDRDTMSGDEILKAIDNTEWLALSDMQRLLVASLFGVSNFDPFGKMATLLTNIFGSGDTLAALAAARVEKISRGVELDSGIVMPGHVEEARR